MRLIGTLIDLEIIRGKKKYFTVWNDLAGLGNDFCFLFTETFCYFMRKQINS